jgi:uncharacterized protein YdcH (DUF465 family)
MSEEGTPVAAPGTESTPAAPAAEAASVASPTLGQPGTASATPPAADAASATDAPWHQTLPDDLRSNELFARYNTMEDALRGFTEAQKVIGKKEIVQGLVPPGENASDVEKQAFRTQLNEMIGVPETADKYTLGGQPVPETLKEFASELHALDMTDAQFNGITEVLTRLDEAASTNAAAELAEVETANLTAMEGEWGKQYDQNMDTANKALEAFGDDDLLKFINDHKATTEPAVLRFFHRLGKQLEEGTLRIGDGGQTASAETPEAEVEALEKSEAFWKPHLDGGKTRRKVGELRMALGKKDA